eukprot:m.67461 g.67461  ORF g.67461 m.67461 type:complete len:136 (-) comp11890_c0_seq2:112-519(-)
MYNINPSDHRLQNMPNSTAFRSGFLPRFTCSAYIEDKKDARELGGRSQTSSSWSCFFFPARRSGNSHAQKNSDTQFAVNNGCFSSFRRVFAASMLILCLLSSKDCQEFWQSGNHPDIQHRVVAEYPCLPFVLNVK